MWLEGLGKLKNSIASSGNRTRDLRACSLVPQPITLPRATVCNWTTVKVALLFSFLLKVTVEKKSWEFQ
jgi:hypothetical protein